MNEGGKTCITYPIDVMNLDHPSGRGTQNGTADLQLPQPYSPGLRIDLVMGPTGKDMTKPPGSPADMESLRSQGSSRFKRSGHRNPGCAKHSLNLGDTPTRGSQARHPVNDLWLEPGNEVPLASCSGCVGPLLPRVNSVNDVHRVNG